MAYNNGYDSTGYGYSNNNTSNPYESRGSFDTPPSYRPMMDDVEMQQYGRQTPVYGARDPNAILNDCRDVGRAIDSLEERLQELQRLQKGFVAGTGASNKEIDAVGSEIMAGYRSLGDRVKRIKASPEARQPRNTPQVNALDRRIKKAINHYQQTEAGFRRDVTEQQRRQYLIVRPDASEAEIREATDAGADTQIFQQALLNSDRRGQAQSALSNVRQRHDAIQQIERTMMELAELFQDLDALVVQQEPVIQNIEKHTDDTNVHMVEANVQLDKATVKARSARRKKWWCLLICVLIVIAIVIGILVWLAVTGQLGGKKSTSS